MVHIYKELMCVNCWTKSFLCYLWDSRKWWDHLPAKVYSPTNFTYHWSQLSDCFFSAVMSYWWDLSNGNLAMAISVSITTLSATSWAESHRSGPIHEVGPKYAQSASKRTALNSGNRDTPLLKESLETQFYACAENQSIDIF